MEDINKQLEAAVAALGKFALSAEATKVAISALQDAMTAPKTAEPVAQPKLPEGYNPHRPGDPCPISPNTWCAVSWPDGSNSEQPGMYCTHAPAEEQDWNLVSGYKIVAAPEPKKEEPKPEWPWHPALWGEYFSINLSGGAHKFVDHEDGICTYARQTARIYKTAEEAAARAELDKRLAMTARLRQLGGGDIGLYCLRCDPATGDWFVVAAGYFSPGEARFVDEKTADAAIETLRSANLLPESW